MRRIGLSGECAESRQTRRVRDKDFEGVDWARARSKLRREWMSMLKGATQGYQRARFQDRLDVLRVIEQEAKCQCRMRLRGQGKVL